jgi:hypothetical protein
MTVRPSHRQARCRSGALGLSLFGRLAARRSGPSPARSCAGWLCPAVLQRQDVFFGFAPLGFALSGSRGSNPWIRGLRTREFTPLGSHLWVRRVRTPGFAGFAPGPDVGGARMGRRDRAGFCKPDPIRRPAEPNQSQSGCRLHGCRRPVSRAPWQGEGEMLRVGPNPLPPRLMAPVERRLELCQLLAAGLLRLRGHEKKFSEHNRVKTRFRLHNGEEPCRPTPEDQWRLA